MKIRKLPTLALVAIAFISSCRDEIQNSSYVDEVGIFVPESQVLQERTKSYPKLKKRKIQSLRTLGGNAPDLKDSPYNKIGALYKVGNGFIGDPENITVNGIIDIESLLKDKKTSRFIHNTQLNNTNLSVFAYSSESEMKVSIDKTNKISGSINLDLFGKFSFGQKKTFQEIFNCTLNEKNTNFLGKLDLVYRCQKIEFEKTDASIKTISYKNMDDSFLYSLYMYPISDYINKNGFLILSSFYTGGKLSALYCSTLKNVEKKSLTTIEFTDAMNASISWESNKVSIDKDPFTKKDVNNKSIITNRNLFCYVSLLGGSTNVGVPTGLIDLAHTTNIIDFTSWSNSLSDKDNHVIVDVAERGLIPINEFMLEENFKQRVKNFINGSGDNYKMVEPEVFITLFKRYIKDETIRDDFDNPYSMRAYSVALKTRHGDFICFMDKNWENKAMTNNNSYNDYVKKFYKTETDSINSQLKRVFKNSKITVSNKIKPMEFTPVELDVIYDRDNKGNITENIEYATVKFGSYVKDYTLNENIVVTKFSLNGNIYKFKNPYSNIWYIYDLDSKSALSYYADEDDFDYITEMYGITDWVNSLKERKLSMNDLIQNYRIIGL